MKPKTELQQLQKRRDEIHLITTIQHHNKRLALDKLHRIEDRWFVSQNKKRAIKYDIQCIQDVINALDDYRDCLNDEINKLLDKK